MAKRICSRPDCDNESNCKGLCRKHYKAMRRAEGYKDPQRDKQCPQCGTSFKGRHDQVYCTTECRMDMLRDSPPHVRKPRPKKPEKGPHCNIVHANCRNCRAPFNHPARRKRSYCSEECESQSATPAIPSCRRCGGPRAEHATYCTACGKVLRSEARRRTKRVARTMGKGWASLTSHRSRARHYGVAYQSITPADIYQRDGWTCGICSQKVDPALKYPDLMSASLDHITPMVKGGGHVPDNVQCSHFLCNSLKGDRVNAGE